MHQLLDRVCRCRLAWTLASWRRGRWPRIAVLVAVALGSLYCSGARQRSARTTVSLGGGYSQANASTYGCHGEPLGTEVQQQFGGSAELVHEAEAGWVAAVEAEAQRSDLRDLRHNGQPTLVGTAEQPLDRYWQTAATARFGWDFTYFGFEAGVHLYSSESDVRPFLALKGGGVSNGIYGQLQLGSRHALWDPTLLSAGLHWRQDRLRLGASLASTGRRMLTHTIIVPSAGGPAFAQRNRFEWGAAANGTDPAFIGYAEFWPESSAGIAATLIASQSWGATINLIVALGNSDEGDDGATWRARAVPLPALSPRPQGLPASATATDR